MSLLYSPQKNEFLNRNESDLLSGGGFLNLPIMLTRSCVVWPSRSIVGTINSSMSTEKQNQNVQRDTKHPLTYVGVLIVRHVGVHAVCEQGQGAVVPDRLPGGRLGSRAQSTTLTVTPSSACLCCNSPGVRNGQ